MNEANRVLTLQELKDLPDGTIVWTETIPKHIQVVPSAHRVKLGPLLKRCDTGEYYDMSNTSRYGKWWRAWLREPTPEESLAVEWGGNR